MNRGALKFLFVFATSLLVFPASAQLEFDFSDTTVTQCKGILYDAGGEDSEYFHNANGTFTICLQGPGSLTLTFESFSVEQNFDYLTFHLGPDENSPQVGPAYSGTDIPPPITITSGCISLHFESDMDVAGSGWEASWTTEVVPPVPPLIDAIIEVPACSSSTATVLLSKKFHCDSVYAAAFEFNGPLDQEVISATAVNCIGDSTQSINLVFSPGLEAGGNYQLAFTSNYLDACDSLWTFTTTDSFAVFDCPIVVTLHPERDSICFGECTFITAVVTGGNGVYSYTWSNGFPPNAGPQNACSFITTIYTLTVDDTSPAAPATGDTIIRVFQPAAVDAASTRCQSDPPFALTANPAGGWWFGEGITDTTAGIFNGDSALGGLNTVSYYLPISEAFGCTSNVNITILPINAGFVEAACPGSAPFQLTGFTPAGGSWSGENITPDGIFDPAVEDTFTVTYSVNGCTEDLLIYVAPIGNLPTIIDSLCESDSSVTYALQPPGGRWSGPGIVDTLTGLFDPGVAQGGLHTLTYSLHGCSQTIDVFVKEIWAGWNRSACPSQTAFTLQDFYPSGGIWSGTGISDPANGIFDPLSFNFGNYYESPLIYTLANGCTDTIMMYVLPTQINRDTLTFCANADPLRLFAGNLENYPWGGIWTGDGIIPGTNPNNSFFDPLLAGNGVHILSYSINTCSDSAAFIVLRDIVLPPDPVCEAAPAFVIASPSYVSGTYSGDGITDPVTGLFDPNAAGDGIHQVIFVTETGCSDTIDVEVINFQAVEIDGPGNVLCYTDSLYEIGLTPSGGLLTGLGVVDSVYFNPFVANQGEHWLYYEAGEGFCSSSDSVMVTVAPSIGYALVVSDTALCYGDYTSVNVNAFGGNGSQITYNWSNGLPPLQQHIVSPPTTTSYELIMTDGCSVIHDTIDISVAQPINFEIVFSEEKCYGETGFASFFIEQSANFYINWDGENFPAGIPISAQASLTYTAEVVDTVSGCSVDTSVTIPGFPIVISNFSINPEEECIPAETKDINFIDLSQGGAQGTWNFGDGVDTLYQPGTNPFHEYITSGEYTVVLEISDTNGCSDKSENTVCLMEPFKIYLPNAFTVNQDGLNEVFLAEGTGILQFKMWVYNRNGQEVFQSSDITKGWDGTFEGNVVQQGVFGWVVEVQWTDKKWFSTAGTVSLVR